VLGLSSFTSATVFLSDPDFSLMDTQDCKKTLPF
jgi:hypothetical protein